MQLKSVVVTIVREACPPLNFEIDLKVKRNILAALLLAWGCVAFADSLEQARQLMVNGEFAQAKRMAESLASTDPKLSANPMYNYVMGVCEFEEGSYDKSRLSLEKAKSKGLGLANLYLGRLAFLDYDFETASELYDEFRNYREKLKQPAGEDVEALENQLETAEGALERVEKIAVIDSLAVNAKDFFKAYRLPSSAGRLLNPEEMPQKDHRNEAAVAFMNEGADFMMWGAPDSVGNVRLVESIRLTDGVWQPPVATPDFLSYNGYSDFPFMMPDGVTLYYASDGEGSIGGYDIFVVTRDAQTGEYLQPQNIGMPFNSPYDDYMLAIDEENGIGWWATDRNELGDKVTIYVYQVNDVRRNYDPEDEDIIEKARLSDYKSTQDPAKADDYRRLLDVVASIDPTKVEKKADFYIPKANGEYYTSSDDFKNAEARSALKKYLLAAMALEKSEANLRNLRMRYARNHADNVREMIKTEEAAIEKERSEVKKLRSEIYRHEKSGK